MDPEMNRDKSRLGRGFAALIPNAPPPGEHRAAAAGNVLQLPIEDILADKGQPRRRFDEAALEELAASIRVQGVLQPILVRRDGGRYRIVAGERRWRASQRAGLKVVPALVKEATERQAFELALIENIQRQDLNPVEEAEAFRRLIEDHELTQEACAERVGKDRSSVANSLRLLKLPDDVKRALAENTLQMGHARALLGLPDDQAIKRAAAEVLAKKLSVRATEELVREKRAPAKGKKPPTPGVKSVIEKLQRSLGTKVRLAEKAPGKGKIEIDFHSHEELERLIEKLSR